MFPGSLGCQELWPVCRDVWRVQGTSETVGKWQKNGEYYCKIDSLLQKNFKFLNFLLRSSNMFAIRYASWRACIWFTYSKLIFSLSLLSFQWPLMSRSAILTPGLILVCFCLLCWRSFFFFLVGKGRNASCTVTPKGAVCGTLHQGLPLGLFTCWTYCPVFYPLKPTPAAVSAPSHYV